MAKIFVVGSYAVGLTLRVPRMPVPGETLLADSFNYGPGGKGSNQAIAAARLGAEVAFLACLGQDLFADQALSLYRREGISTRHIHQLVASYTGVGFITLLPNGENWIEIDPGANLLLNRSHVAAAEDEIAASDWVVCQLEIPVEVVAYTLERAHAHGKHTLLNPAPAQALPPETFRFVDLLTPNESETRILLGLPPDDPTPTVELARCLLDRGVGQVVVTRGKRGALIVNREVLMEVPAPVVQAMDPTGAGDSFSSALVVGLGEGLPIDRAVQRACCAGAFTATRLGVIDGLPTRAELEAFIRAHSQDGKLEL